MSRSRRKVSICGNTTAKSDKWFKRLVHKIFRRREKEAIQQETECPVSLDEAATLQKSDKDGKKYFDTDEHMDLMRK